MKNRILKIAFFLPTLNVGGIERVFITYANSLSVFRISKQPKITRNIQA